MRETAKSAQCVGPPHPYATAKIQDHAKVGDYELALAVITHCDSLRSCHFDAYTYLKPQRDQVGHFMTVGFKDVSHQEPIFEHFRGLGFRVLQKPYSLSISWEMVEHSGAISLLAKCGWERPVYTISLPVNKYCSVFILYKRA